MGQGGQSSTILEKTIPPANSNRECYSEEDHSPRFQRDCDQGQDGFNRFVATRFDMAERSSISDVRRCSQAESKRVVWQRLPDANVS